MLYIYIYIYIPISWHSFEGLLNVEGAMESENTSSVAFATCVVHQVRPRYVFDVVGGRLHRQFCLHGTLRP